ncbi:hypothetical protein CYMTET_51319 [Cymbomonas tetramitiformis]|uniref:Cyclic nucleotide-binding domain-containing protein n=1 Tax=Cymbomonas tetramitiformis TaxID=36881 RepID=A0AAE0BLC0_9CHLO|nr:hypothetical protein CYMTET_51319 [Cymbomonas tetramitiformis]
MDLQPAVALGFLPLTPGDWAGRSCVVVRLAGVPAAEWDVRGGGACIGAAQGEWGSEMYLIAKGRIEVLKREEKKDETAGPSPGIHSHQKNKAKRTSWFGPSKFSRRTSNENKEKTRVTVLESGSFFGEVSMIYDVPRISTCRAITQCDLFSLSRDDFYSVMMMHPEQLEKISRVANQRALMTQGHLIESPAAPQEEQPEVKEAAFTLAPHEGTSQDEAAGPPICMEASVNVENAKRDDGAAFVAPASILKPAKGMQYTNERRAPTAGSRTRSNTVAALGGGSLIDTIKQQAQQRKRNRGLSLAQSEEGLPSQQREIALMDALESSELSEEVKDIIIQHTRNVLSTCIAPSRGSISVGLPKPKEIATTGAGQNTQQSDNGIADAQKNTMDPLVSHSLATSQLDISL